MRNLAIKKMAFLTFLLGFSFTTIGFNEHTNLIVKAKGTKANGVYAHFNLIVNNLECGSKYTGDVCKEFCFKVPFATEEIRKITIQFDNDFYSVGEDRNLMVSCIYVGDELPIKATNTSATYVKQNGEEVEYTGLMEWNGALTFDLSKIKTQSGSVTLSTQKDVNNFSLNYISGDLLISGTDINNLEALSSLVRVKGALIIKDNPELKNITGLNSILEVGFLNVQDNPSLVMIDGFNSLVNCGGMLISDNEDLKTIRCFNSTEIL
jgi:hypothetical protein